MSELSPRVGKLHLYYEVTPRKRYGVMVSFITQSGKNYWLFVEAHIVLIKGRSVLQLYYIKASL
jgi:hypothetical protein